MNNSLVYKAVRDSIRVTAWDSVGISVGISVKYSAWDYIMDSVKDSVKDSVEHSAREYFQTNSDIIKQ